MVSGTGSSTADANISPFQRLTLRPPKVMDLAAFGCRAVVLLPPKEQHKPSLKPRGASGIFLGRSLGSRGCWDVLVSGASNVISSSSIFVDEENFPWSPPDKQRRPLTSLSHSPGDPQRPALSPTIPLGDVSSLASEAADASRASDLKFHELFSGPPARTDGLKAELVLCGWGQNNVKQTDNDGERGGGWSHDLLNDSVYAQLLTDAASGRWDSIYTAFPCSTSSIARFFDASTPEHDHGAPVVRTTAHPDGLPEAQLDPKHVNELRNFNLLLERTVDLLIAARVSVPHAGDNK